MNYCADKHLLQPVVLVGVVSVLTLQREDTAALFQMHPAFHERRDVRCCIPSG